MASPIWRRRYNIAPEGRKVRGGTEVGRGGISEFLFQCPGSSREQARSIALGEDSGEGRWTVQESVELAVPTPVITFPLQQRFRSRQDQPFGGRLLAALRNQFGGHSIRPASSDGNEPGRA